MVLNPSTWSSHFALPGDQGWSNAPAEVDYTSAQLAGGGRYDAFLWRSAVQVHGASQLFWDILFCKVGTVLSAAFHQHLRTHLPTLDWEI